MGAMPNGPTDNRPVPKSMGLLAMFQHFTQRKKNKVFPDIVPAGLTRRAPLGNHGKVPRRHAPTTTDTGRRDR